MGARCDCCDLPVESCGRAVERRRAREDANERRQALQLYGWFAAQYHGTCGICGEPFKEGDPITWIGQASGNYKSYCCVNIPD